MKFIGISEQFANYECVSKIEKRILEWSKNNIIITALPDHLIEPDFIKSTDGKGERENVVSALELFPQISLWSLEKDFQSPKSSLINFFLNLEDLFQMGSTHITWKKHYNLSLKSKA